MEVIAIRHDVIDGIQDVEFDEVSDPRLKRAMSVAMETKKITPLLKEELRLSILTKRLAAGQEEIQASFPQPKSYDLTPAEMEKRARRKEQNKIAARRHRQKSKSKTVQLVQELEDEQQRKDILEQEYTRLSKEKEELLSKLIAVSCDHCENEAGSQPIKTLLSLSGTIRVESSVFTVIQWEGLTHPDSQSPPPGGSEDH